MFKGHWARYVPNDVMATPCPMEAKMHIAIARFPTVPAERDQAFRDWFAWSNDQLRDTAGLKARRLLRALDGSYTALVEHENADTFAAMHSAGPVSKIHEQLGEILDETAEATKYDVVVDYPTSGGCCGGGSGAASHEAAPQARASSGCCRS